MKILLTGASGFIGRAVVRLALERGHEVAALSRAAPPAGEQKPSADGPLRWLRGDLENPPWADIVRFGADWCIHAAWIADAGAAYEFAENDDYGRWSLAFLRRVAAGGTARLLGLGTCVEYQMGSDIMSEDRTPLRPLNRYARAKHALRLALEQMVAEDRQSATKLCWARPFYVYGLGEPSRKLCSALIRRLACGEETILRTPRSAKDYIHVRDVAGALLTAVEADFGGALNIGMGHGVTVERIALDICALLGQPTELVRAAEPEGSVTDPFAHVVADVSRLRGLGWRPSCDLRTGLAEMVAALA